MNNNNKIDKEIIIKELNSTDDLIKHFSLRYEAYRNSGDEKPYIESNEDCLDIDFFDFYSRAFSIIYDNCQIATMRMVTPDIPSKLFNELKEITIKTKDPSFKLLRDILKGDISNERLGIRLMLYKKGSLPTASYFDICKGLESKCSSRISDTIELSRNAVNPDFRGNGLSSVSLLAGYMLAEQLGYNCVIGSCKDNYKNISFYKNHGYDVLEELGERKFYLNGISSIALHIHLNEINSNLRKKVDKICFNKPFKLSSLS